MADDIAQRITALPELTVVDVANLLAIVDTSTGKTKKITVANLLVGVSVTKVGTPVDNEVAVWTGDGTIEGDANFVWDAVNSKLTLAGAVINLELDDDGELDFYSPGRVEGTRLFQTAADFEIRGVAADDFIIAGFTGVVSIDATSLDLQNDGELVIYSPAQAEGTRLFQTAANFEIRGVNADDFIITGFTNLLAGTVDADFDALTATSYGGILEANLLDQTQSESITGIFTFVAGPLITGTGGVIVENAFPTYQFREDDAAVDNKNWWFIVNGEQFDFQLINDLFTVTNTVFRVPRTGVVPDWFGFMEGIPVRIYDSTDTDFMEQKHDGTDFLTDFTNTGAWKITGLTGIISIDSVNGVELLNDGELDVYSAGQVNGTRIFQSGIDFNIKGVTTTDFNINTFTNVRVRDGAKFRIEDSGDTDWAEFSHDGTDFNTTFVNTTDWNISGANLRIVNDIGFYNTAPVAQPTGVAVTAAGIHAALVTLGLITA